MDNIESVVVQAEARWHLSFHITASKEAHAPCPFCRDGKDRFIVFQNGGYWCRKCGIKGWLDEKDNPRLTAAEWQAMKERSEAELAAYRQRQQDRRMTALQRLRAHQDHLTYHKLMNADDRKYWHSQGINDESIERYLLGVCYNCPTDREHRPSYTLPVIHHGKLWNIRHRLIGADNGDKYRPHAAGLGNTLYLADNLYVGHNQAIIVEGEKKAIVTTQEGFPSVGLMGMRGFPAHWAARFETFQTVIVLLDPDAQEQAEKTARLFEGRGLVASLPVKADDFFVLGGKRHEFDAFLRYARKVD